MRTRWSIFVGLLFLVGVRADFIARAADPPANQIKAEEAFARLNDGNQRFISDQSASRAPFSAQRAKIATGQSPLAVILTCSDSRVVPEMIFNQQLGDLFVVRVAGNVTDPVVLGSMEYGVEHLHAALVVVLGHTNCGAVKAAIDGGPLEGNLGDLIKQVHPGDHLAADKEQALEAGVRENVLYQTKQLTAQSKVLSRFADAGKIRVMSGVYSLETGKVEWLKAKSEAPAKP